MNNTQKFDLLPNHVAGLNTRKVVYIGQDGSSGYANAAKGYVYDLIKSNIPTKYISFSTSNNQIEIDRSGFSDIINKHKNIMIPYPTEIIIHSIPAGWDSLLKNSKQTFNSSTKLIGRTVWEFEKVPKDWIDAMNNSIVHEISVPTEWNKKIFIENGITKPIVVNPHIFIDYEYNKYSIEDLLKKSVIISKTDIQQVNIKDFYKFYTIGQFTDRKNILKTIDVFCKTFKSTDNVILFLKTFKSNYSINEQIECVKELNNFTHKFHDHAPIVYIKDQLNQDEIHSMHRHFDCYFSLTHTEGFGLGIFDAFNHNKKIIVTGYGGHIEYLGKKYEGLVDYKLTPVNAYISNDCFLGDEYQWADPDENHAINLLQKTYVLGLKDEQYKVTNFIKEKLSTPLLSQQPNIKIIDLSYTVNDFYFNSAIFSVENKNFLMARYCHINEKKLPNNTLKLFDLDNNLKEISLNIKNEVKNEQYEDPRVLYYNNKIYVGCANYQLDVSTKIHQKILVFDKNFNHIDNIHPIYDGNGADCNSNTQSQKNWTYFIYENKILCVYKMYPHIIVEFDMLTGKTLAEYKTYVDIHKIWKFGEARMGTNPILKDGIYHNFFHSSIPWKNPKRQYLMGYYTFEAKPPFKIIDISDEPIIWGNETDFRFLPNNSPLVVFPCGAIYENNNFYVSFGFNDEKTGIIKI